MTCGRDYLRDDTFGYNQIQPLASHGSLTRAFDWRSETVVLLSFTTQVAKKILCSIRQPLSQESTARCLGGPIKTMKMPSVTIRLEVAIYCTRLKVHRLAEPGSEA